MHTATYASRSTGDTMHPDTVLFAEVLLPDLTLCTPRVTLAVLQQGCAKKSAQSSQKGSAAIPWGWGRVEPNARPWELRGAGNPFMGVVAGSVPLVPAVTAVAEPSPCPRAGAAPSYLARHSHGSLCWQHGMALWHSMALQHGIAPWHGIAPQHGMAPLLGRYQDPLLMLLSPGPALVPPNPSSTPDPHLAVISVPTFPLPPPHPILVPTKGQVSWGLIALLQYRGERGMTGGPPPQRHAAGQLPSGASALGEIPTCRTGGEARPGMQQGPGGAPIAAHPGSCCTRNCG